MRLHKDPQGKARSEAQLEFIIQCQQAQEDIVTVMPTGSGKSISWNIVAMLNPNKTLLVIVPFRALLEQHLEFSIRNNIRASHFQISKDSDLSNPEFMVKILFCVPESLVDLAKVDQ